MTAYVQVALAVPLRQNFTYSIPNQAPKPALGTRVKVRFGPKERIGIVVDHAQPEPELIPKIKPYLACLDTEPVLDAPLLKLAQFIADYYFSPIGQVLTQILPVALRKGSDTLMPESQIWHCTEAGAALDTKALSRAPKQAALLRFLQDIERSPEAIRQFGAPSAFKALKDKGLIAIKKKAWSPDHTWRTETSLSEPPLGLNKQQQHIIDTFPLEKYSCGLIHGVTGSGKTEVYLQLIERVLKAGKQVLVLVPEIGLTPQTIARFSQRFAVPIVVLHSHLNDQKRLEGWKRARTGDCAIVIGTRSALFTPLEYPGMIIIDEEHDSSFKQQEGTRYHARDLAVFRAHQANIPIILGSATPSLESLQNAQNNKYHYFELNQRAGHAEFATHEIIDIRQQHHDVGLSQQLLDHMEHHLAKNQQVLLFLNRRGYAPALLCQDCGHLHGCDHCDAYYTVHQRHRGMQCHHCGDRKPMRQQCQVCHSWNLTPKGLGTQQLESYLQQVFPHHPVLRIDRDTTKRQGDLDQFLTDIQQKKYSILIGTQMLAKGHHFPDVTLVGILECDQALFQADFRASEKFAQLYTQVAGRAGREHKRGHVVLQTRQPDHPLLQAVTQRSYQHVAQQLMQERHLLKFPPYQNLLLIRIEGSQEQAGETCAEHITQLLRQHVSLQLIGPIAAPMARKADQFRHFIMLQSTSRKQLQGTIHACLPTFESLAQAHRCRLIFDRDPQELS